MHRTIKTMADAGRRPINTEAIILLEEAIAAREEAAGIQQAEQEGEEIERRFNDQLAAARA